MGKITSWNDAEIAKLNPGVTSPTRTSRRSIGAMVPETSFAFTD